MAIIHIEEEALQNLSSALNNCGDEFVRDLAELTKIVNDIKSGAIQGPPADQFLLAYEPKQAAFNAIAETIAEMHGYMGTKTTQFNDAMDSLRKIIK